MLRSAEVLRHCRPTTEALPSPDRSFSPFTLHLCWFGFVALHGFSLVYFSTFAWCYWNLPGTFLNVWLCVYEIGIGPKYYRIVAIVHGCLAAIHFVFLVWILGWSFKKRKLVFGVYNVFTRPGTCSYSIRSRKLREEKTGINRIYHVALSKLGVLGVDGPYFDLVLLFREVVETALQTQQAYRMSVLSPRVELNRGYVGMLVINCWSTALVHSVFQVDTTKRRLLAVVADCALDLVTSVGITTVLLATYYPDFDLELSGFPPYKWYEDVWVVHVLSEFQILLVSSWWDLTLRVFFALSMISNMNNMKKLLSMSMPKSRKFNMDHQATVVLPLNPSLFETTNSRTQNRLNILVVSGSRTTQILFLLWGTAILVAHLFAESISDLPQCEMQVKPWITSEPSCSLLVLDCYESKISGRASELINQWSNFDRTTTSRIVIRHCPKLEVPDILTDFSRMKGLKIYNSTITSWNESAALSQLHHPILMVLYLVRVNLPNGELPTGLLSDDFPRALTNIEICSTNLRCLPEDLDLKWPQYSSIYFEDCEFTEVPASLARLAPFDLSLAMNPISILSPSLFEGNVGYLHVGSTLISELPALVTDMSSSFVLRVDNTNVSFFWDWIDPIATNMISVLYPILATNSPYCSDLGRIYDGEQTKFSTLWRDGQSRVLSDASENNWPVLQATVSCDPWPSTWYPLDFEDKLNGIKDVENCQVC